MWEGQEVGGERLTRVCVTQEGFVETLPTPGTGLTTGNIITTETEDIRLPEGGVGQ